MKRNLIRTLKRAEIALTGFMSDLLYKNFDTNVISENYIDSYPRSDRPV